jgi:hypothetical protein
MNSQLGHNFLLASHWRTPRYKKWLLEPLVQLWLVDADCAFYEPASLTPPAQPISVHVPPLSMEESIATLQQFSTPATTLLTDLTEARPLVRTELSLKTLDGGQ